MELNLSPTVGFFSSPIIVTVMSVEISQHNPPDAIGIRENTVRADDLFADLQKKQLSRKIQSTNESTSATQLFWKHNLVPFDIFLEDGFYDPGRVENTIDKDIITTIPPLASFFNRNSTG